MSLTELVFKKYILILALHWDCSSHSQWLLLHVNVVLANWNSEMNEWMN